MATHDSGKVDLVMVACVAQEVTMIVQPAIFYRVSRVHILNYVSKKNRDEADLKRSKIYEDVRDEVENQLRNEGMEVILHCTSPTYKFNEMMREVFGILTEEKSRNSKVFVNISGGTNEYAAAAAIASNMFDNTQLFNVGRKNSMESAEHLRASITRDGKIVGTIDEVWDPFSIDGFRIDPPDQKLLEALSIFASISLGERTNTNVVRELIKRGTWKGMSYDTPLELKIKGTSLEVFSESSHRPTDSNEYYKRRNSENVRYQKMFVDKWKEKGWVWQDNRYGGRKYDLTDEGKMHLRIFRNEDV